MCSARARGVAAAFRLLREHAERAADEEPRRELPQQQCAERDAGRAHQVRVRVADAVQQREQIAVDGLVPHRQVRERLCEQRGDADHAADREDRLHEEHREQRAGVATDRARARGHEIGEAEARHYGPTSCISDCVHHEMRAAARSEAAPSPTRRCVFVTGDCSEILRSGSRRTSESLLDRSTTNRCQFPVPLSSHSRRCAVPSANLSSISTGTCTPPVFCTTTSHTYAPVSGASFSSTVFLPLPSPNTPRGLCDGRQLALRIASFMPPTFWNPGSKYQPRSVPSCCSSVA